MDRKARTLLVVAMGTLALAGCRTGDARLKDLTAGITKDSALAVLGVQTGERPATYLVKGQMIEAMMLRREGIEGPLDSLSRGDYTPIVIVNGQLAGWGWKYWDSVAQEIGVAKP